ncbi:DUF6731 family protein [Myxococcus virescens]|uniref:Uncharacterized protein n=1 Tax=Myxococcus virescens TaxID=83456 RepID=A0A511HIH3_9BACT|nr:DUF6731 family protein [Myxococcus virescens]GEL73194.1 hypothetical protein MVI01_49780 [Myxococcus virescens]SDD64176.1 hypothetical protein SAMN04488504_10286 [Myxococcus virescens]
MKMKTITVDFYKVEGDDDFDFAKLLSRVGQLAPDDRLRTVKGGPFRLEHVAKRGIGFEGELVRIRMDYGPTKASLSTAGVEEIPLREDEGVGEETAFLYHPGTAVLLLQRNRIGATANSFASYFSNHNDGNDAFGMSQVLELDALLRLNEMEEFREFEVEVAGIDLSVFNDLKDRYTWNELQRIRERAGAPRLAMTLKMGHARGALNRDYIRKLGRTLLNLASSDPDSRSVTSLKVRGKDDMEDTAVVDLLNYRMIESVSFPWHDRRVSYDARQAALREAFSKRETELKKMFGQRKKAS